MTKYTHSPYRPHNWICWVWSRMESTMDRLQIKPMDCFQPLDLWTIYRWSHHPALVQEPGADPEGTPTTEEPS